MSHIRVLVCRVDDPTSDTMAELAAFDLPSADVATLQPDTALDDLETTTQLTGTAILRRVLQAQCDLADRVPSGTPALDSKLSSAAHGPTGERQWACGGGH